MEFARIGLLVALLIGMRKRGSTARKRTTLDPKEASMKNPRGPTEGKLKGRRNLSKNRHGTAVSMLSEHAQLRKRIAELDLWLRELERNRFDHDHKDRWCQTKRPSKAWNRRMRCPTISQKEASRTDRRLR